MKFGQLRSFLSVVEHLELPEPGGELCRPSSEFESYDLIADPWQLQNLRPAAAPNIERVRELADCSGIRGRDPELPGRPFCE